MGLKRRTVVAACALAAVLPGVAGALPVCATPTASAPAFAQGSQNVLSWTIGSPNGAGFDIEVASEPIYDLDGSFEDGKIVRTSTATSTERARTVTGLAERTFSYHVRAKAKANVCTVGPWSGTVATTQDATQPSVSIANGDTVIVDGVSVPTTYPGTVRLAGYVTDEPGLGAPAASGPRAAVIRLVNTTPTVGDGEAIEPRTAFTDVDGSWSTTYSGLATGVYVATASGFDVAGNESVEPATHTFIATPA